MEARASMKQVRMSPKKLRLVADLIRGKGAEEALGILTNNKRHKASNILWKAVTAAIANARETMNLDEDRLYIKTLLIDEGPTMHRWRPVMRGRAHPIKKRTSKVTLVLDEREN